MERTPKEMSEGAPSVWRRAQPFPWHWAEVVAAITAAVFLVVFLTYRLDHPRHDPTLRPPANAYCHDPTVTVPDGPPAICAAPVDGTSAWPSDAP